MNPWMHFKAICDQMSLHISSRQITFSIWFIPCIQMWSGIQPHIRLKYTQGFTQEKSRFMGSFVLLQTSAVFHMFCMEMVPLLCVSFHASSNISCFQMYSHMWCIQRASHQCESFHASSNISCISMSYQLFCIDGSSPVFVISCFFKHQLF